MWGGLSGTPAASDAPPPGLPLGRPRRGPLIVGPTFGTRPAGGDSWWTVRLSILAGRPMQGSGGG